MSLSSTPPVLDATFADYFALGKPDLLDASTQEIIQTGAARLGDDRQSWEWPAIAAADEPLIETFVIPKAADFDLDGAEGTGSDRRLIEAWWPLVEQMTQTVFRAARTHGIVLHGPAYVTASVTPVDQTAAVAHFDDDMLIAGEGVGLVGIVGSIDGPRVAIGRIGHPVVAPPTQLTLPQATIDDFAADRVPHQQGDPNHIVIFPQFGQLHAGPKLETNSVDGARYLMVLRGGTQPKVT